jgi:hypothetical protein
MVSPLVFGFSIDENFVSFAMKAGDVMTIRAATVRPDAPGPGSPAANRALHQRLLSWIRMAVD